jgi:hypothetical protein
MEVDIDWDNRTAVQRGNNRDKKKRSSHDGGHNAGQRQKKRSLTQLLAGSNAVMARLKSSRKEIR